MRRLYPHSLASLCLAAVSLAAMTTARAEDVNYQSQIAPLLTTYCAGCHNDTDFEAEFSVSSYGSLMKGSPQGTVVTAGAAESSRLLQLLTATDDSLMPPEGEPRPSADEIAIIKKWIEAGAAGPERAMSLNEQFKSPQLPAAPAERHYVGAACLISEQLLATGSLGRVQVRNVSTNEIVWETAELPGKVNSLRLSPDGKWLIVGGGVAGLGGEVALLNAQNGKVTQRLLGHTDAVYCASMSPDGKWIASGSYDRKVILWEAATGTAVRELTGHNGPIYDLDFDPSSQALATASGDQTIKLWNVLSGGRLDTFGQPEGEMLCVRFSADGQAIFAGSADRQIRKWQIVAIDKPTINPMTIARFAHESEVLQLQPVGPDRLISISRDQQIKLWSTATLEPLGILGETDDLPVAVSAFGDRALEVVELTGRRQRIAADAWSQSKAVSPDGRQPTANANASVASSQHPPERSSAEATIFKEAEPNDTLATATAINLPAEVSGLIAPSSSTVKEDIDLYRFEALAGQTWIFEIKAARDQSKLDSRLDVLDETGAAVLRTRLQAVRETYFTFRGKDSNTIDDFRLHKWEDMELDEFLFANGEVVRLWLYPRGPDSGFKVYPGAGSRVTYYDTTPVAHALGQPAYIVRELKPGEAPLPNGLPTFPIYFENDDDSQRRHGRDSRLTFTAPQDGTYFLRVRDARGFGGPDFPYQLSARVPRPDFSLAINTAKLEIPLKSGREWSATATRLDGLEGPISIELKGLPAGLIATNPLVIEAGQISATGTIYATDEAALQSEPIRLTMTATTSIDGEAVSRELPEQLELSILPSQGLRFELVDATDPSKPLQELTIHPGETTTARIVLERNGVEGPISFGNEDSGRGLPHGAYVDNIGLNGLLIPAEQNEREFFITAAPKLAPGRYPFHLRSTNGNPTSRPIWLNVIQRD
jgi:WD40 repeat protein